jgi:hypothetical protein
VNVTEISSLASTVRQSKPRASEPSDSAVAKRAACEGARSDSMEATVEPAVQMMAGVRGPVERTTARRPIPLQVPAAIDVSDQATKPHPRILSSDPKGKGGTTHPKSLALFYFSIQLVIMRDAYFAALHIAMQ